MVDNVHYGSKTASSIPASLLQIASFNYLLFTSNATTHFLLLVQNALQVKVLTLQVVGNICSFQLEV